MSDKDKKKKICQRRLSDVATNDVDSDNQSVNIQAKGDIQKPSTRKPKKVEDIKRKRSHKSMSKPSPKKSGEKDIKIVKSKNRSKKSKNEAGKQAKKRCLKQSRKSPKKISSKASVNWKSNFISKRFKAYENESSQIEQILIESK